MIPIDTTGIGGRYIRSPKMNPYTTYYRRYDLRLIICLGCYLLGCITSFMVEVLVR